jgi:hypothetical protein
MILYYCSPQLCLPGFIVDLHSLQIQELHHLVSDLESKNSTQRNQIEEAEISLNQLHDELAASTTVEFPSEFTHQSLSTKLLHVIQNLIRLSQECAGLVAQKAASQVALQKQTESTQMVLLLSSNYLEILKSFAT